jgi:hypothetical protein
LIVESKESTENGEKDCGTLKKMAGAEKVFQMNDDGESHAAKN